MEGTDGYKGDDSHEIAAFMRMFMDMVGISESDSIPAGTFLFTLFFIGEVPHHIHGHFLSIHQP